MTATVPYGADVEWPEFVVGFLSRIDTTNSGTPWERVSLELDALWGKVDLLQYNDSLDPNQAFPRNYFDLIRISTTLKRFISTSGGVIPRVGDWYFVRLSKKKQDDSLPMWRAPLGPDGFGGLSRGWANEIDLIKRARGRETSPQPLGAAIDPEKAWARQIADAVRFPNSAVSKLKEIKKIVAGIASIQRVIVRDVGQASYCSLRSLNNKTAVYYDIGWPLPFNHRTYPSKTPIDPESAPIILSHWDWDHLSFAVKPEGRHLLKSVWIAPAQPVGPAAACFSYRLARARLVRIESRGIPKSVAK